MTGYMTDNPREREGGEALGDLQKTPADREKDASVVRRPAPVESEIDTKVALSDALEDTITAIHAIDEEVRLLLARREQLRWAASKTCQALEKLIERARATAKAKND